MDPKTTNTVEPETPDNDSLEGESIVIEPTPSTSAEVDPVPESNELAPLAAPTEPPPSPSDHKPKLHNLSEKLNIYIVLFILVLLLGSITVIASYMDSKNKTKTDTISTQDLSKDELTKLANSDTAIGSANQVLNIQSSAVFSGKVLVRQDLEIAGNLQLGGILALKDLTATGTTQLGDAQINKTLSVAGNTSLQGSVTVAKSLQVNGGGTFNGPVSAPQLTTSNLQLNGDLVLTRHITAGGPAPGRTNGTALGSGGTSSVSGSDTSGTVTINTGGAPAAGCFITVNFANRFNSTPRILLTPFGSPAGGLDYYTNRTSTGFSICVSNPAPAGSSFGFDYFVIN